MGFFLHFYTDDRTSCYGCPILLFVSLGQSRTLFHCTSFTASSINIFHLLKKFITIFLLFYHATLLNEIIFYIISSKCISVLQRATRPTIAWIFAVVYIYLLFIMSIFLSAIGLYLENGTSDWHFSMSFLDYFVFRWMTKMIL